MNAPRAAAARRLLSLLLFLGAAPLAAAQAPASLQQGDLLALCGDSITQQKFYTVLIEDYLLMCQPAPSLQAVQFGVGGETVTRFAARMKNDVLPFKPTAATIFYGMNDGGYVPSDPARLATYRKDLAAAVQAFKQGGTRLVVVGSPGVVDTFSFKRLDPAAYNKTLGDLADAAKAVAAEQGAAFADVHTVMGDAMAKAKAKYGDAYLVAGGDGIHPQPNGHLAIAYAFLRALGCSGDVATITLDLQANSATGTDGQKIVSAQGGTVEVESTRYPFCFTGDAAKHDGTLGMSEFVPFNQDLNRYLLVVKNASSPSLKVTWGAQSKAFPAADLEKGVNLAAEFPDNPFSAPFARVHAAILAQQAFETPAFQNMRHEIADWGQQFPDRKASFEQFDQSILGMDADSRKAAAAALAPVKHTLKVEAAS